VLNYGAQCPSSFLQAHRASLTPNGHGWWLVYQIRAQSVLDRDQESIDVRSPIAASDYDDALEIAKLILQAQKPPDTELAAEQATPIRTPTAYHVLGVRAASKESLFSKLREGEGRVCRGAGSPLTDRERCWRKNFQKILEIFGTGGSGSRGQWNAATTQPLRG
jgi:hypothetical protein